MAEAKGEVNNLGKRIILDIDMLIKKDETKKLTNADFMNTWTDIVLLPVMWIEKVITESIHTKEGYTREQAVIYGLLLRAYKILIVERNTACAGIINHQLASTFSRILFEDSVNVQYFILHPEAIDTFCKSSAKAEQEFVKIVEQNRLERTEAWTEEKLKWEEGLYNSALHGLAIEGVTRDEKPPKEPDQYSKAAAVGLGDLYNTYRSNSHAIHGHWYDIAQYMLEERGGKYYPIFQIKGTDIRELNTPLLIVYKSLKDFLAKYPGHGIRSSEMIPELDKDRQLIWNFDNMYFNYRHKKPIVSGMEDQITTILYGK